MNTIIIEPNSAWSNTLKNYVEARVSLKLVGVFQSFLEAYHILHSESIDLILLNIELLNTQELDFTKGVNTAPLIIFSNPQTPFNFTIEDSIITDVVTPSVTEAAFQKLIEKAEKWREKNTTKDFFFIRTNNRYVKLVYDDIIYIKSLDNFVQIVTSKETFTKISSMKKILEQLPSDKFMQVHRSFIVNVQEVNTVNKDKISMGDVTIPIGRAYKDHVSEKLVQKRIAQR